MTRLLQGLTPDIVAAGLVAACRQFDLDPIRVFDARAHHASTARTCAAAAVLAVFPRKSPQDGASACVCAVFAVPQQKTSPSQLKARGITTEHLLPVVEAMKAAGLDPVKLTITGPGKVSVAPAKARTDFQVVAPVRKSRRQAVVSKAEPFDPAVLVPGRTAVTPDPAPIRLRDVDAAAKPFDLGPQDMMLVRECVRQGGFPQIYEFDAGGTTKIFWITPSGQNWKHHK